MNNSVHRNVHLVASRNPTSAKPRTKSKVQDELLARQLIWVDWLRAKTGKSLAALARDAGRSPNLLTRKLADGGLLSTSTIELLMESTGLPGPDTYLLPSAAGFSEEAVAYDPAAKDNDPVQARMIEQALKGRPNAAPWVLKTRALEDAGYLIGDIVITDGAVQPMANDAVVAQRYENGTAETIFRILHKPYLVAASNDPGLRNKPLYVDDNVVIVMGTITHSFRARANRG